MKSSAFRLMKITEDIRQMAEEGNINMVETESLTG